MSRYLTCLVPAELVEQHQDWTECAAFRFRVVDDPEHGGDLVHVDGAVELEVTNDLDLATAPERS